MLTNLLAWSMAIASLGLYLLGFFLPELYRRFDLIASGAGLFFALTLWIYGDRLGGGLLLGTAAAVALILWFGWQTLSYRWQLTYPGDRTDTQKAQALWQKVQSLLPEGTFANIAEQLQSLIARLRDRLQKQPDRPQPPVDTPPPPMDTGDIKEDLWTVERETPSTVAEQPTPVTEEAAAVPEESVKSEPTPVAETTASPTAAPPTATAADHEGVGETLPTVTAPEASSVETPQPPTATTSEEPEPPTVAPSEELVASSQEQASPETAVETPEPTVTPEAVEEPPLVSEATPNAEPIPEHTEAMPAAAAASESPTSAADLLGDIPDSGDVEDEATPEETTIENPEHTPPEDDDWPPREARL
ncbi:Ycf66 family protein [Thermosynechococcus sp.]|uniref:Ycf66 family protein n=1 Tax=Thermosynechococcus sp. TaxID=2814275 RepID=UPI00391CF5D5